MSSQNNIIIRKPQEIVNRPRQRGRKAKNQTGKIVRKRQAGEKMGST